MSAVFGHGGVLLGFVSAVVGALATGTALVRGRSPAPGRRYAWLVLAGALVATGAMEAALVGHDFSIAYVAGNDSRSLPLVYQVTALWSALQGSILLWCLLLAGFITAMVVRFRDRAADPLVGWATVTAYAVAAFFFGLILAPADPFRHVVGAIPADGPGPNALLHNNLLVTIHPPLLYLGYVGFTIPFAFAIGALVTGRLGERWLQETRTWTLVAWGALTAGIVLGAWWSYQVLGWGGYWAWDPVENASLLPWLCGTAYLHSVAVQQRRGMLRVWNLALLLSTFSLTVLGTFLTRSGVLQSVHSFSASTLGPTIIAFFGVTVAVSVGLVAWRGDGLRSPGSIDSPVSREGAFLANNLAFALFALIVLLGTVFPLLVQAVNGSTVSVGAPYFDRMTLPIAFALLFLMAVAPVLPWRKGSTTVLSDRLLLPAAAGVATVVGCAASGLRGVEPVVAFGLAAFAGTSALRHLALAARRNGWRALLGRSGGGMVVHVGVVILAVGFAASASYGHRGELTLPVGGSARFDGHTLTFLGMRDASYPDRVSHEALVRVDGGAIARPSVTRYSGETQGVGSPFILSGPRRDIYLTVDAEPSTPGGPATIGVVDQPLITWLWTGGGIMVLGCALAAVPVGRRRPVAGPPPAEDPAAGGTPAPPDDDSVGRRSPVGVA